MASKKRPAKPVPRRSLLPWVAMVLVLAAAAGLYLWKRAPGGAPEAAPTAALQPELSTQRAIPRNRIYPETVDPRQEIAAGLKQAKLERKRVLLDFGGDWCGDCQVLDLYLHQRPNRQLLEDHFVLVHVYIGEHIDQNLDIPAQYNVPVKQGVPALAVLDSQGKLLYSQTTGEFENMRSMDPAAVTEFLNRWKA